MFYIILVIGVIIGFGYEINDLVVKLGLMLLVFVFCLLVGIVFINIIFFVFKKFFWLVEIFFFVLIFDVSLGLFLVIFLMSL